MNFANLTGLSDSYGNVVQIADAAGNVIWKLETNKPVILEVEKITSDTYAGETLYSGEQFILLDIYPKTNGTVSVTYGGLTKTITDTSGAEDPNAIQVFFGTFNGVSDSVVTPDSGTLTIKGDFSAYGVGAYIANNKGVSAYCTCIHDVIEIGEFITKIPQKTFQNCTNIALTSLPSGITEIGSSAFQNCTNIALTSLPSGITEIENMTFFNCTNIALTSLPSGIVKIGTNAFYNCTNIAFISFPSSIMEISKTAFQNCTGLKSVTFENTSGWRVSLDADSTSVAIDVSDPVRNVQLLTDTYLRYNWHRS